MLEHHRELRAHALQLLVVGDFAARRRLSVCVRTSSPSTTMLPGVRLLEKVDAAQERALARPARADDADHVARVGLQRHALEHFVVAVALVDVLRRRACRLRLSRVDQDALPSDDGWHVSAAGFSLPCGAAGKRASDARRGGTAHTSANETAQIEQRGDAERVERLIRRRVRIARDLQDVRHGGREGDRGGVQHQDHFVTVVTAARGAAPTAESRAGTA